MYSPIAPSQYLIVDLVLLYQLFSTSESRIYHFRSKAIEATPTSSARYWGFMCTRRSLTDSHSLLKEPF